MFCEQYIPSVKNNKIWYESKLCRRGELFVDAVGKLSYNQTDTEKTGGEKGNPGCVRGNYEKEGFDTACDGCLFSAGILRAGQSGPLRNRKQQRRVL